MLRDLESIEGITPEQIEAVNKLVKPVIDKKDELLAKVAKKDDSNTAIMAELEALKEFKAQAEIKAAQDSEQWQEVIRLKEEHYQKQIEELTNQTQEKDSMTNELKEQLNKVVVENTLTAELAKLNVDPVFMPLIQKDIASQAVVADGKAMIGDKSLSEYLNTDWAETDIGKAARIAPTNSGTGAQTNVQGFDKPFAEMTLTERSILANTNPEQYNMLKGN